MMRPILLATWMLFMISSINSLSPAEKIITRGSSSFPSYQNPQDVSLMTSAKALLAEVQSASAQEPHDGEIWSLRKKRAASDKGEDYKRFSGFKVVPTPSFSIDIAENIYEGGFSSEAVGNCLLASAGALVCSDKVIKFPEVDGKNTYKLVSQGSYRVHLNHAVNGDVKLSVTFGTDEKTSTLTIPGAFSRVKKDTGHAVVSTLLVDSGIYIAFFSPERPESLTVAFFSFSTEKIVLIQEFDIRKNPTFEPKFATDGIKDVKLIKIGRAIFMIIAREDKFRTLTSLALKMVAKDSATSFKLQAVLDTPANSVQTYNSRFGTHVALLDDASYSVYTFNRGSFVKLMKKNGSFDHSFSAFTDNPEQELVLRMADQSKATVMHRKSSTDAKMLNFSLPAEVFANGYESVSIVGFGKDVSSEERFLLYAKVYNFKDKTFKLKGFQVNFDAQKTHYSLPTPLESDVDYTALHIDDLNDKLQNIKADLASSKEIISKKENLDLSNVQIGDLTVSGTVKKLKKVDLDIVYKVTDADQVSFKDINYNDETSVISHLIDQSTIDTSSEDYLLKNSILKNSDKKITVISGATITIPNVVTTNAVLSQVATETVSNADENADVVNFITQSLRTDNPSTKFNVPVIFSSRIKTNSISFNTGAKPKNSLNRVDPSQMFDITKENMIESGITMNFTNIKLSAEADFQGGLNGIDLATVVKTSGDKTVITGDKTFSKGITVGGKLKLKENVNGADVNKVFSRSYIFKEDPKDVNNENYVQTIKTKRFDFNTIKILDHLNVKKMGESEEFDVVPDQVVVTNKDAGITTGKVTFKNVDLTLGKITADNLNSVPVENNFVHDATQTFSSSIEGIKTLYVKDNLKVGKMNGVDLDADVARVDVENTFESEVNFTTLGVSSAITMGSTDTVNGVDLSHTQPIQRYPGTIHLTGGTLRLKQDDVIVEKMDFGTIENQSMLQKDFADEFVYTDTNQNLPNLVSVPKTTVLDVADLSLRSTIDSLNLATDIMHTSSDVEASSSDVKFTGGVTTFSDGMTITTGENVGPYSLLDLHNQAHCGHNHKDFKYKGLKTVPKKIVSNADISVPTSLTANQRSFGSKTSFNVVKTSEGNTLTGKMTFSNKLETTSGVKTSGSVIDSSGSSSTPKLNNVNIGVFDANVVRNIELTNPVITQISNKVTMSVEMADGVTAVLMTPSGTLDGTNVKGFLDEKVLLDEARDVNVHLTAPNIKLQKGIEMKPTDETKENYFNEQNLVKYAGNLFKDGDNSLGGKKTVTGTIKCTGNLKFASDIHPFGIDIPLLKATGFQKSVEQTISLPYTIGDITEVNKVKVDKIDGVNMADICFTDEQSCTFKCDASLPTCVHFKKNLNASGGISFDKLESIEMGSILGKLDSNDNSYNLNLLKITSGGFDWTTDADTGAVSGLLKNLVVKSNKDWSSREDSATAVQTIAGSVDFLSTVTINDLDVTSGLVNAGTAAQVDPVAISVDGALKAGGNFFTGAKTFTKEVKAKEATITKIVNLKEINDLDVEDYKNKAVYSTSMDDPNQEMVQTITGAWTLSNGIKVGGEMDVRGSIDGVAVDDFVRRNEAKVDKDITKVTFSKGVTVIGNVDATGTDFENTLDSFMANRIRLSTDDTINNNLRFSGDVELKDTDGKLVDVTVTSLNNIPANTWAVTGSAEPQSVGIKTVFNQDTVIVNGNLATDDLHGTDLSAKWADALKINKDALISGPDLTFADQTVLLGQKLSGTLPPPYNNTLAPLMRDVSTFVGNLHDFYTSNIVNVIPKLDQEIRIAKRLDLGMVSYLDEVPHPQYLAIDFDDHKEVTFNATKISSLELDENLFSMNYKIDSPCDWKSACLCQTSVIASPLDSEGRVKTEDRLFSFTLPSSTIVLRSTTQSSSSDCTKAGDGGQLIISGVFDNPESVDLSMLVLTPTTVGSALKSQDLNSITADRKVGYVESAVMWELGTGIYLAVASSFPNKMIAVFRYDTRDPARGWEREDDLAVDQDVSHLKAFTFSNLTKTQTHLYAIRDLEASDIWMSQIKEILVFHQVLSPEDKDLPSLTKIPEIVGAPGLVNYEVFLHEDKIEDTAQVTLLVAQNYKFELGPDISVVVTLVWDPVYSQFIPAIVPDNVQHIGGQMVKLEAATISNHKVLIVAEESMLSVYRFIPYQGLRLIDQVETGAIVDFAVTKKNIQSDTLNIYVIEADKKTRMFRLYTEDTVPTISLKHGYYQ